MEIFLLIMTGLLAVPAVVFFTECLAALWPNCSRTPLGERSCRVGVIVPAHDEQGQIAQTVRMLRRQLRGDDRLIVVADNCTDRTADRARAAGAQVLERHDPEHRGKGYALQWGVAALGEDPPQVVIFVDADCDVPQYGVDVLAAEVQRSGRPVQAVYIMQPPENPSPRDVVSALAFRVKNLVRPRGAGRFGVPCHLTGTGMAWPWDAVGSVRLGTGAIVEDMQFGVDLAIRGHASRLVEEVTVIGRLPCGAPAAATQRTRWEHGHLRTIFTQVPRLVWEGVRQGRPSLWLMALDLCVPPLSLLVMMLIMASCIAGSAVAAGFGWTPFLGTMAALGLVGVAVGVSWGRFARDLPISAILAAPWYVLWKVPIYVKFLWKSERRWIRTERDTPSSGSMPKVNHQRIANG